MSLKKTISGNTIWGKIYFNYYRRIDLQAPLFTDTCNLRRVILLWIFRGGGKLLKPWMPLATVLFSLLALLNPNLSAALVAAILIIGGIAAIYVVGAIIIVGVIYLISHFDNIVVGTKITHTLATATTAILGPNTIPSRAWTGFWHTDLFDDQVPLWLVVFTPAYLILHALAIPAKLLALFIFWDLLIVVIIALGLYLTKANTIINSKFGRWMSVNYEIAKDLYTSIKDRVCIPFTWI